MSFLELFTVGAGIATIPGVFLAIYGIINNKALKQSTRIIVGEVSKILKKVDTGFRLIALLTIEEDKEKKMELMKELWKEF